MSAVSIKIPPFWTDRPEIWFYQVEAQFQISRISLEETKFHYLVSQLEPKYVENIWDIVNSKSATKYTDSKNRLLSLFKESENLRIKRLLTGIELGDMKPSQLLQKLKTVATSDISDNLIKTLWLEKLPESIKNILVVSDENLSKLAVMADKISDMTPRTEIVATGKSLDCGEATSSRDQLLLDRIQSLEEQICVNSAFSTNQERKNAIVFILNPEVVLGNVSTPKENIVIFTSISVLDANLKSAARLVHGIGIRKTSVCSKYCDKFCCRRL
ncbi:uncharacterized protein TNCV_1647771 [Trichonephila clavipes]|uniref:DUF7041 domain-containing protein n=1 Tax=Trichonephila clavipes TaxID=2585209 RepID=A0A8X6RPP0_TRICX|nr:uncharacterized protein TNCV_1647771 [Trichonephila clavipes]